MLFHKYFSRTYNICVGAILGARDHYEPAAPVRTYMLMGHHMVCSRFSPSHSTSNNLSDLSLTKKSRSIFIVSLVLPSLPFQTSFPSRILNSRTWSLCWLSDMWTLMSFPGPPFWKGLFSPSLQVLILPLLESQLKCFQVHKASSEPPGWRVICVCDPSSLLVYAWFVFVNPRVLGT